MFESALNTPLTNKKLTIDNLEITNLFASHNLSYSCLLKT